MKYHLIICPFYLIQMLCGRAQLFLTNPRTTSEYMGEFKMHLTQYKWQATE